MLPMRRSEQQGFTLVEAVLVIVLTGIVAGIVSVFIVAPVRSYLASSARAQLVDQADTALRRIGRDIAVALPNSVRTLSSAGGASLELIPSSGAARYATEGAGRLDFGVADNAFDLVGPGLALTSGGQQLVFYNLGPDIPDADAYAGTNRRSAGNGAGIATTITMANPTGLPVALSAPPYRVFAVEQPVSYRCDKTAHTLTRYSGYGFLAAQPDPPVGGSAALLARGVKDCDFAYSGGPAAARTALVTLRLTLESMAGGGDRETITLHHALHVDNQP